MNTYEMRLDPKNTLFPSEMKLLANTLRAILGAMAVKRYYALRGKVGVDQQKLSPEEESFIERCYKETNDLKRLATIISEVEAQYEFLSTYTGEEYKVKECQFIAKRLEVILPKMRRRYYEIKTYYGSTETWLEALQVMQDHFDSHDCNDDCENCPIIQICMAP